MPRPVQPPPYLKHHKNGATYARTKYTDVDGRRVERGLGLYGSPESYALHKQLVAEWQAKRAAAETGKIQPAGAVQTVGHLVSVFMEFAENHYKHKDGTQTSEFASYATTIDPLLALYAKTPLADFGPLALKAVRQAMVSMSWLTKAELAGRQANHRCWSRKVINQRINRIRHIFKWGASEELVPIEVYEALRTVQGLQAGRSAAPDYEDVPPVPDEVVEATLPHLHATGRAMVQLQRLTGIRPGELVIMRPCDVDTGGLTVDGVRVWIYRPAHHKTAWRGHKKAAVIGPQAQDVLRPFLDGRDPHAYCFSPREAMRSYQAGRSAARQSKRYGQAERQNGDHAKARWRDRYTVASYGQLLRKACQRHNIQPWHPHQLRHSMGTQVTSEFSLDGARTVLGQKDPNVTAIYAARDLREAARIVAKIG